MSDDRGAVEKPDSATSPGSMTKVKKFKQMRLPFAPISNAAEKRPKEAENTTNKRKKSESSDTSLETPNKILKADCPSEELTLSTPSSSEGGQKKTPRRIKPTFIGCAVSIKDPNSVKSNNPTSTSQKRPAVQVLSPVTSKKSPSSSIADVTKPTGDTKIADIIKPTGDTKIADVTKPTGDTKIADITKPTGDTKIADITIVAEVTKTTGDTTVTGKISHKLTPKQEARRKEFQKKKEEKERLKQEELDRKKQEREQARLEKERIKEETRIAKEVEKKKKEEEKRIKEENLKAEKARKIEMKKMEKELKEEARLAEMQKKQMEKEQKLEEKRKQEEAERLKKEKITQAFAKFFIKKQAKEDMVEAKEEKDNASSKSVFNQFRVKKDMRLAPVSRRDPIDSQHFEAILFNSESPCMRNEDYLSLMKKKDYNIGKSEKTWPLEDVRKDDDEVEILDDEDEESFYEESNKVLIADVDDLSQLKSQKYRAKLLQFYENQRPPYFGTWSKKSKFVGPRRPLGQDKDLFNYDEDSDDDWEEEKQGESLSDEEKDKEDDEELEADEDDDDGFFVGHGVLDKDELHPEESDNEECGEKLQKSDGFKSNFDEELEEKKQKLKAQQFEEEYKKKKPIKLKPRVFGCMWVHDTSNSIAHEQLIRVLKPYKAINLFALNNPSSDIKSTSISTEISSPIASPTATTNVKKSNDPSTPSAPGELETPKSACEGVRNRKVFPKEALKDLINLVHANTNSKLFLAKEFAKFWENRQAKTAGQNYATPEPSSPPSTPATCDSLISNNQILKKITEIAQYEHYKSSEFNKKCWVVKQEVLDENNMTELKVPNSWSYFFEQPNSRSQDLNKSLTSLDGTPKRPKTEQDKNADGHGKKINQFFPALSK